MAPESPDISCHNVVHSELLELRALGHRREDPKRDSELLLHSCRLAGQHIRDEHLEDADVANVPGERGRGPSSNAFIKTHDPIPVVYFEGNVFGGVKGSSDGTKARKSPGPDDALLRTRDQHVDDVVRKPDSALIERRNCLADLLHATAPRP